jgi:hypothetical protein
LNDPSAVGYLAYLLWIFVPGLGFAELLGVWGQEGGIGERLAVAFGMGLAVDTLVAAVKTSGLRAGGLVLSGMDASTVYATILLGLAVLSVSYASRRKLLFPARPKAQDLFLLFVILLQALMVYLYFQKYPIFPEYQSPDYANHVQFAQGLASGSLLSIPRGILYFGVHFQLAASILLAGGEPLVTVQRTMAVLVLLSPLVVYLGSKKIFSGEAPALVVTAVYSLTGTIWFDSVFNSGLYANFFGIIASLFLLAMIAGLFGRAGSPAAWAAFVLAAVMAYFSHYTAITLLPALLIVPVAQYFRARSDVRRYLLPPLAAVAPGAVALLAFPGLASLLITLAEEGGGSLSGSTALSLALSGLPVLGYMALEVFNDTEFVFLFIFAAVYAYRARGSKLPTMLVPLFWFLSLLVSSPTNVSAWRFSFEALVPLTLMAGYGLSSLLPKLHPPRRRGQSRIGQYAKIGVVLAILLAPLVAFSWGQTTVSDSLSSTGISAEAQRDVYAAIYWLKSNTPADSRYLSVSDWRFTYTSLFFGRTTDYAFVSQPSQAISLARSNGDGYIIVTDLVTAAVPPIPSLFPWNNFRPSSNLTLVYSNSDVEVFKLV